MKISSVLNQSQTRDVEARRTPVTRADLRAAIGRALERTEGKRPSGSLVDVLTAQASLETASGQQMYNYNFGGIKGRAPDGSSATYRTKEVVDGHEVSIRDGFRAYRSLDEGALDYVRTMKSRFGAAMSPAEHGDVAGFAHALKKSGYYTASEADYAKGLTSLLGSSAISQASSKAGASGSPGGPVVDDEMLARIKQMLDQGFAHSRARLIDDTDDEDA